MTIMGVKIESRQGDDSDFTTFNLSDVNYVNLYRPRKSSELIPVYHTSQGSYAPLLTLKDISTALKPHGFSYFDKSTIINKHRVKHIKKEKTGLIITFVDYSEINVSRRSLLK